MSIVNKLNDSTRYLDKILEVLAVISILLSIVLAFYGVVSRYLFGLSSQIIIEGATYSIIYGVFLYIGPLIKYDEHIKMEILNEILGTKAKVIVNLFISVLSLFSFSILFYGSIYWAFSLLDMGARSLSGEFLLFVPALAIFIGMFLGALYSLLEVIKNVFLLVGKGKEGIET